MTNEQKEQKTREIICLNLNSIIKDSGNGFISLAGIVETLKEQTRLGEEIIKDMKDWNGLNDNEIIWDDDLFTATESYILDSLLNKLINSDDMADMETPKRAREFRNYLDNI